MKLLIDTSVFIDYLRQKKKADTVLSLLLADDISPVISIVTVGELYAGLSSIPQAADIERLLGIGEIVQMNLTIAKGAGEITRDTGISLLDGFIAATALYMDYSVVTLNKKDFQKVNGLRLFDSNR